MISTKRVTDRSSIFDTLSQIMVVDAAKIIPIIDRCLIQDVPENDRRGLLYIPESANNRELVRQGIVIAVGPGDKYTEHGFDNTGQVRRKQVRCEACDGFGAHPCGYAHEDPTECEHCHGTGCGRLPMPVKAGDRVLYSKRREAEISVGGVLYSLINAEQSIYALLEAE